MSPSLQHASGLRLSKSLTRGPHPGVLARIGADLRLGWRHWCYSLALGNWGLRGRMPMQVKAVFRDVRAGNGMRGEQLLTGHITCGETGYALDDRLWEALKNTPEANRREIERFDWLLDLAAAADQDAARKTTEHLVGTWCDQRSRWDAVSWDPGEIARRLTNWLAHIPLLLANPDMVARSKILLSVTRQARHLARAAGDTPRGLPRLYAGAALMLAGLVLPGLEKIRDRGLAAMQTGLADVVLPDGGPRSRFFPDSEQALMLLLMVKRATLAVQEEYPTALQSAIDRIGAFLRALQHGDGSFAAFHGLAPDGQLRVHAWLKEADAQGGALENAAHTGMQRLTAGNTCLIVDVGPPPPLDFEGAHASTGAFEFSDGLDRLIVNMGTAHKGQTPMADLVRLVRTSAAHSMMVIGDRNVTTVGGDGRLEKGITSTSFERETDRDETRLMVRHDGYQNRFKVRQSRQFRLSRSGDRLMGEEILTPVKGKTWPATPLSIRFHLHPKVTPQPQQDGTLDLITANGARWRLASDDGDISLQESLYLRRPAHIEPTQVAVLDISKPQNTALRLKWSLTRITKEASVHD